MLVTIIIPTYHDWPRLKLCLKALQEQYFQEDNIEILVVNNDPGDLPPKSFEVAKNVRIISEVKSGSYAARNAALKIARGEIIGFTDSDCIPDKNWIKNAIDIFKSKPEISRIGGKIEIFSANRKTKNVELYDFVFAFPQQKYCNDGFAVTGNMFSKNIVFSEIGLFDEDVESGGDSQWGFEANQNGYPIVYSDRVLVKHPARDNINELLKKTKRVGRGMLSFEGIQKVSKSKWLRLTIGSAIPKKQMFKEIREHLPNKSFKSIIYVLILYYYLRFYLNWTIYKGK